MKFLGLRAYVVMTNDHKQLKTIAHFFDTKKHAKDGFTNKSKLVLCSNPYMKPLWMRYLYVIILFARREISQLAVLHFSIDTSSMWLLER